MQMDRTPRTRIHTPFTNGRQPPYVAPVPVHIIHEMIEAQTDVHPSSFRNPLGRGINVAMPEGD